ncbi:hypothetical protein JCM10020v2_002825 [Rhodotorula toruloides]
MNGGPPPPPPPPPGDHPFPPPPPPLNRPPLPQSYTTSSTLDAHRRIQHPQQLGAGYGGQQHQDTRTQLFVSNLPFRVRWQDLKDLMRKCGTVLRADVALSPTDGRSRGFGVVLFAKAEDAAKAIATYHGYTWQTRVLDVRIDAQDPTGALALAEANRQQAAQKAQQQGQRGSPVLPPPPPPPPPGMMGMPGMAPMGMVPMGMAGMGMVAAPFGPMLVQVPSPLGQTFLAPAQQQPQQRSSSPYLSPEAARSSPTQLQPDLGSSNVQSRNSSASPSPSPAHSPAADSTSPTNERKSPLLAPPSRDPSSSSPVPPPPPPPPPGSSSNPDIPPQFQHLMAMQHAPAPPAPSSIPPHLQQHQHPHQPHPQQAMVVPMMSIHPMGYAVPAAGLLGYYPSNGSGRPGSAPPGAGAGAGPHGSGQYTNRHLFVGNLPFNCQWQELKDLMRGAGNVLRADIAQGPDGRSRGFGSVLFASQGDAERAVGMFNGYEFNGRALKVHFDKFAGAAVNPNQNGPNSSNGPSHHYPPPPPPHHAYPPPPPPQHPYPYANGQQHQQQQQQFVMPFPTRAAGAGEGYVGAPSPLAQLAFGERREKEGSLTQSRPGTAVKREEQADATEVGASEGAEGGEGDEEERTKYAREPTVSSHHLVHPRPHAHPHPASSFSRGHHHPAAPSRIAMPPPLPFASLAGYAGATSASAATPSGPFSPLGHPTSTRLAGLGPMTPSMPAFTFGGAGPFAAQPTPPIMPGGMFSPGDFNVGPFSPGVPFFGGHQQPNGTQGAGAWKNVAPGQQTPGFNPMFPAYPYSAAHAGVNGEYAQQEDEEQHPQLGEEEHQPSGEAEQESRRQEASDEPSYFPPVSAPSPATTITRSPLVPHSASAPPLSPRISPIQDRPSLDDARTGANGPGHSVSETLALSNAFEGLAVGGRGASRSLQNSPRPQAQAQLDVGGGGAFGSSLQPGWAEGLSPPASAEENGEPNRRRSLVAPAGSAAGLGGGEGAAGAAQRGVSVGPTAKELGAGLVVPDIGATGGPRRASMDSSSPALAAGAGGAPSSRGGRAAFGTSIWG